MKISAITPKPRLFEDMIREDTTYKAFNRAGRMLVELKMSEKEILDLFANIEKGATAGGGNRTALGKGKDAVTDVATAISNAFGKVSSAISSSAPVAGFDVAVDKMTDGLATAAGGQSGAVMTAIKKYREFAKERNIDINQSKRFVTEKFRALLQLRDRLKLTISTNKGSMSDLSDGDLYG